jgi:exodeoxyribonuclease V gamma subunit
VEVLVDVLGEIVSAPLADPLTPEVIAVPSRGFERWIAMRLAERFSIWGNPSFPFPRRFVQAVIDASLGNQVQGWDRAEVMWRVARLLEAHVAAPGFGDIAHYLEGDEDGVKRVQLSRRIADVFDQYSVFRPELVLGWEQGIDPEDWQAILWRNLVGELGSEHMAARATRAISVLAAGPRGVPGLPERASIFGLSSLAPLYLQVVEGLARHTDVHLFILSPCREYWADLQTPRAQQLTLLGTGVDGAASLHVEVGHPLLASLGRLGRDFQGSLEELGSYQEPGDLYRSPGADTLLHRIQESVLCLDGEEQTGSDGSVEVHACHSALREVEVLRDRLLALFDGDPSLDPAEVVVLTPDIEAYSPFVEAVFGVVSPESDGHIPFVISDRPRRADGLVADAFLEAVGLLNGRMAASDLVDLLRRAPVRSRFGLEPDDIGTIETWVAESGIRWGEDEEHRAAVGQPRVRQNTWRFGLDRLLVGVASEGRAWGGVLPYDDMEGGVTEVLGQFVEFVEVILSARESLRAANTVPALASLLIGFAEALLSDVDTAGSDSELRALREILEQTRQAAETAEFVGRVSVEALRSGIARRFDEQRLSRVYMSGAATFCQLLPMRSVPFRVVCLLGMNHDAFPRTHHGSGFDKMAGSYRRGDRSIRDEDRYIFLEALLSARDHFLVFHVGQGERDNRPVPPSVVVSELLDMMGAETRDAMVIRHPLQPFSPSYFERGSVLPVSYAMDQFAAASSLSAPAAHAPVFVTTPLPVPEEERTVCLEDLVRFLKRPVKWFISRRLGLHLEDEAEALRDREPLSINALERWGIGSELVRLVEAGASGDELLEGLRGEGRLPLGVHGDAIFSGIYAMARQIVSVASQCSGGATALDPVAVDLQIGDTRVTGELRSVYPKARVAFGYSKLNARGRIDVWVHHLALQLMPELTDQSVAVGPPFGLRGKSPDTRRYRPVAGAERHLRDLLDLYWAGQRAPLPFFPDAALSFLWDDRKRNVDPDKKARWAIQSARSKYYGRWGSSRSSWVQQAFGGVDPIAADFTVDTGEGVFAFADLARRVLGPVLDCER